MASNGGDVSTPSGPKVEDMAERIGFVQFEMEDDE